MDCRKQATMYKLEVGKPFISGISSYEELPQYSCRNGLHLLVIPLANIRPIEQEAITEGAAYFAFTVMGDVLVFQYRFGRALAWSDSAYNWYLVPEDERGLPDEPGPNEHALMSVVLVEATNGLVAGLRVLSLSPTFASELRGVLAQQSRRPKPADFVQQAQRIFNRYSSSQLREMALSSCIGGDNFDRPAPF
jgi:hypothetical protein